MCNDLTNTTAHLGNGGGGGQKPVRARQTEFLMVGNIGRKVSRITQTLGALANNISHMTEYFIYLQNLA